MQCGSAVFLGQIGASGFGKPCHQVLDCHRISHRHLPLPSEPDPQPFLQMVPGRRVHGLEEGVAHLVGRELQGCELWIIRCRGLDPLAFADLFFQVESRHPIQVLEKFIPDAVCRSFQDHSRAAHVTPEKRRRFAHFWRLRLLEAVLKPTEGAG